MGLDAAIYEAVSSLRGRSSLLDSLMLVFEVRTLMYFYFPLMMLLWLTRDSKLQRAVLITILALAVTILLRPIYKGLVDQPRPWLTYGCPGLSPCYPDNSMPSGHAVLAFSAMVTLWKGNRQLGWGMAVVVLLTCISRMYLGEHWPSDLLVGGLLGCAIGFGVWRLSDVWPFSPALNRVLDISERLKLTKPKLQESVAPAAI
jgi:undecaprenyl-diphosphatase